MVLLVFVLSRFRISCVILTCWPTCKVVCSASMFWIVFVRTRDCSCWLFRDLLFNTRELRGLKVSIILNAIGIFLMLCNVVLAASFKFHFSMNVLITDECSSIWICSSPDGAGPLTFLPSSPPKDHILVSPEIEQV